MAQKKLWHIKLQGNETWWGETYWKEDCLKQSFRRLKAAKKWVLENIVKKGTDLRLVSEKPERICYNQYIPYYEGSSRYFEGDAIVICLE